MFAGFARTGAFPGQNNQMSLAHWHCDGNLTSISKGQVKELYADEHLLLFWNVLQATSANFMVIP